MTPQDLELLSAYHDGEVSDEQSARIEQLLESDPAAREALGELRHTSQLIAGLPRERAPADLHRRLQVRAEREALLSLRAGTRGRAIARMAVRWSAIAAALALVVTGWMIYEPPFAQRREDVSMVQHPPAPGAGAADFKKIEADSIVAESSTASAHDESARRRVPRESRTVKSRPAIALSPPPASAAPPAPQKVELTINLADREKTFLRLFDFIGRKGGTRISAKESDLISLPGMALIIPGGAALPDSSKAAGVDVFVESARAGELLASLADLRKDLSPDAELAQSAQGVLGFDTRARTQSENEDNALALRDESQEVQITIRFEVPPPRDTPPASQPTTGSSR